MNISNKLKVGYWIPVVVSGLMIVGYEGGCLVEGGLSGDKVLEYYWTLAMELVTICAIPLALMLFRLRPVKRFIQGRDHRRLNICRIVRLGMLSLPMVVNVYLYYQFIHPGFGYMAIIGLLSSAFVYPSAMRCQAEDDDA